MPPRLLYLSSRRSKGDPSMATKVESLSVPAHPQSPQKNIHCPLSLYRASFAVLCGIFGLAFFLWDLYQPV